MAILNALTPPFAPFTHKELIVRKLLNILDSMSYTDIIKNFAAGIIILLMVDCAVGVILYMILPPEIPALIERVYNREGDMRMLKDALRKREIDGLRFKAKKKVA